MVSAAQILFGTIVFLLTAWSALSFALSQKKVTTHWEDWMYGIKSFTLLYFCYSVIIGALTLMAWGMKIIDQALGPGPLPAGQVTEDIAHWLFQMLYLPFFLPSTAVSRNRCFWRIFFIKKKGAP